MKNKYYFYRLPAELLEQHGPTVAAVYSVLLNGCTEGIFRTDMKVEVLAQKCHMSERHIRRTLDQLEELGLIRRTKDGRRTLYDILPVLPAKKHDKDYIPEPGKFANETYEDLLLRIPNWEWREHLKEQLLLTGINLKSNLTIFPLRSVDQQAEMKRNGESWGEYADSLNYGNLADEVNIGSFVPFKKGENDNGENE